MEHPPQTLCETSMSVGLMLSSWPVLFWKIDFNLNEIFTLLDKGLKM